MSDTPTPITAKLIEAWATKPENKERARALGMRLIQYANKSPAELASQPTLGAFEDRATLWAIGHQTKARLLVMRLLPKLK